MVPGNADPDLGILALLDLVASLLLGERLGLLLLLEPDLPLPEPGLLDPLDHDLGLLLLAGLIGDLLPLGVGVLDLLSRDLPLLPPPLLL